MSEQSEPLNLEVDIEDSYPTEAMLEDLKAANILTVDHAREVLRMLHDANIYTEMGYSTLSNDGNVLRWSTGGWSGNEDIISALESNLFFYVNLSKVMIPGGHYLVWTKDADHVRDIVFEAYDKAMAPKVAE